MKSDRLILFLGGAVIAAVAVIVLPDKPAVVAAPRVVEAKLALRTPPWAVFFSPSGGCTDAIVHEIRKAKRTIKVQAYNFSSQPITNALIAAHARGVDVQIIIDHVASTEASCTVELCHKAGIAVFIDAKHKIAHNKILIYDSAIVSTGSFNLSENAEHNAENILVVRDKDLAKIYSKNWDAHRLHSTPWAPAAPKP